MTDDALDVLDTATVAQVVKCDGGSLVIGTVWKKEKAEEGDRWESSTRLHVATSDAAVAKLVRDYLRLNVRNEAGLFNDEDDGG